MTCVTALYDERTFPTFLAACSPLGLRHFSQVPPSQQTGAGTGDGVLRYAHLVRSSPTIQGLRAIFRAPSLWLAEIAWRWSFWIATLLLLALAAFEFLGSVPLSKAGQALVSTKNALMIALGVIEAFQGTGPRLIRLAAVLLIALPVLWMFAAAVGRTATVNVLVARSEGERRRRVFRTVLGLSFLRSVAALAALAGFVGAAVFAFRAAGPTNEALLGFLGAAAVVAWIWGMLNWILVLASIFPPLSGASTMSAIAEAAALFRRQLGRLLAINTGFALAHAALFVIAVFLAVTPASTFGASPRTAVAALIVIVFAYAAVIDFLYIARLAAYVAVADEPSSQVLAPALSSGAPEPAPASSPPAPVG